MLSAFTQRLGLSSAPVTNPELDDDNDSAPPAFPALNSQQRAGSSTAKARPPPPSFSFSEPDPYDNPSDLDDEEGPLPPVVIEPSALTAPTSTTKLQPKKRKKVAIEKGYSQLDWGRLQRSGEDLRGGITSIQRITTVELAQHRTKDDCWQAYGGKVYNVTRFLKFHPGGVPEMMRAAGKDGTELFMRTHAWVNIDMMLEGCLIGFLVRE